MNDQQGASRRFGMLVDLRKCYGCHSCTVACKQEHEIPPGYARNCVETVGPKGDYPNLSMHYMPRMCAQCQNPPCVESCTEGAIERRADGVVLIHREKCIGDGLCVEACPYGAIQFDSTRGVPEKCDLCVKRLDAGIQPSCVVACVGRALLVGDLEDPESRIARAIALAGHDNLFVPHPEYGTGPSLYYIKPEATSPPLAFTSLFDPDQDISAILPTLVTPVDEKAGEKVVRSLCRGCHGVCGVRIIVRNGRVIKVEGDPECPTSFGTLCPKGLASTQYLYSPDRLLYPLKRAGERGEGKWERISWDEALDTITARLAEIRDKYGPEYVALSNGTGRTWNTFGTRFFNAFGTATKLPMSPLCYFPRIAVSRATVGYKIPIADYYGFGGTYPACVLVWGNNNVAANADGMAGARLIDTINRGARLIVVDPVFTNLAAKAETWLPVRPASDGALALGLLNVVVSEELYDREFVAKWTNGPFLVRRDTGELLTERDLDAGGSPERWMVWDRRRQTPVPADELGAEPSLHVFCAVKLADGSEIRCQTVWMLLKERLGEYSPEVAEAITWVPAERIRQAARVFAASKPAVIQWGLAFDQQGVNSARTIHAALTLMAITGNLDVPGGMAFWVSGDWIDGPSAENTLPEILPQRAKDFIAGYGKSKFPLLGNSGSHGSLVGAAVAEGSLPLQAVLCIGVNPLVGVENSRQVYEAFKRIPFIVVFDLYITPSAEMADIVLPISTWLERDQIGDELHFVWGVFCRQRAIEPLGECRADEEILMELGKRLGLGEHFPWSGMQEYLDWRLRRTGVTWEEFKRIGLIKGRMRYRKYETNFYREGGGFKTATGKVELYSTMFKRLGADPLPFYEEPREESPFNDALAGEFPLIATNRRVPYFFHTEHRQVPWLRELEPEPVVEINPATAKEQGIEDGEWVFVETKLARIRLRARVTPGVHPLVVCCQHGWWFPERGVEDDLHGVWESNLNVLTRNDPGQGFDPLYGCPQLRGFLCRIRKS